jgi:ABC-2 type transport system ATP-binding protein
VAGRVPWKDRVAHVREIGAVFGQRTQLWWDLPVVESFDLLRDIYRVPGREYARARDELVTLLDLESILDVPVRQLSLGQRMRCDLAASLLHSPRLLFLDEPTIGLDAPSKLAVRGFIQRLNREEGTTVLLTTHDTDDIEALCSRVLVIAQGRILFDGTMDSLRVRAGGERRIVLDLADEGQSVSDPDASFLRREGKRVFLSFEPARVSAMALVSRLTARYAVRDLMVENPPIEEVIARLYRKLGS